MTKKELLEIVERNGMEPLYENLVTMQQIGFYVQTNSCTPELDDLVKKDIGADIICTAEYIDGGNLGALYKIYCPKTYI